jgi:hypothetical protein
VSELAMREVSAEEASKFISEARFAWHERFVLGGGVTTPGPIDLQWLWEVAGVDDLSGKSVLEVGVTNGGVSFLAERAGARSVVAGGTGDEDASGFGPIREFLGSRVEYVQSSIYELRARVEGTFDLVIFWNELTKLRHPLLGLDALRELIGDEALIASAVCDHELEDRAWLPLIRYYRRGTLSAASNDVWFVPTIAAIFDWCRSSGLEPELVGAWPREGYRNCMIRLTRLPGNPEYMQMSAERPLIPMLAQPTTDAGGT